VSYNYSAKNNRKMRNRKNIITNTGNTPNTGTTVGLFLGSGASRYTGLPTSGEIIEKTDFKNNPTHNTILEKCNSGDIEEVLETVEQCKQWIESGENIFDGWIHKVLRYQEYSNVSPNRNPRWDLSSLSSICTNMQTQVVKLLPELFSINEEQKTKTINLYQQFLDFIAKINKTVDIFTTNYDRVIEKFVHGQPSGRYQYVDGFPSEKISEFSIQTLLNSVANGNNIKLNLYRLHGGLDWYKAKNKVSNIETIHRSFDLENTNLDNGVIIPPILGKNLRNHPLLKPIFDTFAKKFLEYDICIIIGFSFRDKDIASVISQRITNNKKTILIGPHVFSDLSKHLFPYEKANMENDDFHESRVRDYQQKYQNLKCYAERFLPENMELIIRFIEEEGEVQLPGVA